MSYTLHTYNVLIFPIHDIPRISKWPWCWQGAKMTLGSRLTISILPEVIIWRPYRWQNDPGFEIEFLPKSVTASTLRSSVESSGGNSQKKWRPGMFKSFWNVESYRKVEVVKKKVYEKYGMALTGLRKRWTGTDFPWGFCGRVASKLSPLNYIFPFTIQAFSWDRALGSVRYSTFTDKTKNHIRFMSNQTGCHQFSLLLSFRATWKMSKHSLQRSPKLSQRIKGVSF